MTVVDYALVRSILGEARRPAPVAPAPPGVPVGMANTTEREFTQTVISLLNGLAHMPDELGAVLGAEMDLEEEAECAESLLGMEAVSFQEEGVMSSNEGLTVRLPNGRSFQLTVVRSR